MCERQGCELMAQREGLGSEAWGPRPGPRRLSNSQPRAGSSKPSHAPHGSQRAATLGTRERLRTRPPYEQTARELPASRCERLRWQETS